MAWRRLAMCALRVAPLAALFFALVDCLPTEPPGFEAAFQGRCGEGSPCEQLCRELHDGTFECGCEDGYVLLLDGYGCMHNNFTKTTEVSLSADVDDVLYARVTSLEAELVQAVEFDNSTTPRHVDVTTQSNIVELEAEHRKHLDGISSLISDGISKVDLNLISDDDDFSEDFKYTTLGPSLEQKVPSVTIPPPWTQSVESCDCKCQGRCSTSCNKDQCKNVQIKVPRFSGNSWLALHTLRGAYKHVRIRMRFRPERLKGVLLLTGEHDDMSGDYLALVINEGKVELRFDCGSGPAVVRSSSGVRLGRWNSVTVWRHRWDAWLKLNSQKRVKGRSEGLFSRMTFREPVWIGGSGNTTGLKSKLGISDGFIGCLDYLKINGDTVDLVKDSLASYDVGECAPSLPQWKPELTTETKKPDAEPDHVYNINDIVDFEDNDIVMRDAQKNNKEESDLNKKTYDTISDPVAKPEMEIRRPVCDCQHGGGCVNDVCLCPLGYAGERCEITLDLKVPRFNGSSYLRLPGLGSSAESWLSIQITIKPSTGDGILLFNSDHVGGSSDYFSLTLKNFYVELALDLGSGVNTVRSAYPLQANQWHRIIVNRTGRKASLAVQYLEDKLNEYNNAARYVWCVGLNRRLLLRSSLALGGKAGETSFQGCVRQLVINDQEISIVASALGGVNVDNCYQEDELKCRDTKLCEENLDTLPPYKEMHPHRVVPKKGTKYKKRKLKKHDVTTNDVNWVESSSYPSFSGQDSFIHIDDDETVKRLQSFSLDINIRFRSVSSEGLLVWSGVSHKTEDFMSLGIEDSVLVFRYNLGSGEVVIVANHTKVDDGLWHRARATRNRQAGVLEVDGLGSVGKISPGKLKQLNTYNGLYLGGLPTIEVNSLGKYKSGLIGCISQISLSGDFDIPLSLSKLPHTITNKVGKCTP